MCELAVQDVAEDLRVAVGMCREAIPWRDTVLIEYTQTAEVHELVVEIAGEAEGVERLEPAAVLCVSALAGAAEDDLGVGEWVRHGSCLLAQCSLRMGIFQYCCIVMCSKNCILLFPGRSIGFL